MYREISWYIARSRDLSQFWQISLSYSISWFIARSCFVRDWWELPTRRAPHAFYATCWTINYIAWLALTTFPRRHAAGWAILTVLKHASIHRSRVSGSGSGGASGRWRCLGPVGAAAMSEQHNKAIWGQKATFLWLRLNSMCKGDISIFISVIHGNVRMGIGYEIYGAVYCSNDLVTVAWKSMIMV